MESVTAEHGRTRSARVATRWRKAIVGGLVAGLAATGVGIQPSQGTVDPSTGTLDDVPSTAPSELGDIDLTELQYGDPTENLALVDPPEANNEGTAQLEHPLPVPPGRADVEPSLALTYDSSGGTGWVGAGWDLSVGAITVDTTYGAPRYDGQLESETYALDGDRLFPNAIRSSLALRNTTGVKDDFVRQVETEYERIIRHGTTPSTYYWQVTDKVGTDRWYGGSPEGRDAAAVLTASATNAGGVSGDFHWALSYVEDISGNVMRLSYDELSNVPMGRGSEGTFGTSLYLRTITYTGSVADAPATDDPPYRVTFLRDADVPGATPRKDVVIDARGGAAVVTRDLLRGIEVHYVQDGEPDRLVRGYRLEYDVDAPFDKTLLTRVGQYGTGGRDTTHAWHDFVWYDDVTVDGTYVGFGPEQQWDTVASGRTEEVNIAATSALGSSGRGSADGGAYIGFNPVVPSKIGSFGGSFNIAGGPRSDELSMLLDVDGDSLPDKVTTSNGKVQWQRNTTTPTTPDGTAGRFAAAQSLQEIDSLGRSRDIRIDLHLEAHPVVSIQVGGGFAFSMGERYFEDVNDDGRPDFVKPGSNGTQQVYFNVLTADGTPRFVESAATTPVPLDDFSTAIAYSPVAEVVDLLVATSPRIDTVRRWAAPFTGTVRVVGNPTLADDHQGDGARVTVEHAGVQRFAEKLDRAAPSGSHDLVFPVTAGEAVFFRVHVIENGADDVVAWAPRITYVQADGTTPVSAARDANDRSQVVYSAADDFTLFGRDGARTAVADPGPATMVVTLTQTGYLSDDVDVAVRHYDNAAGAVQMPAPSEGQPATLPAGALGSPPAAKAFTFPMTIQAPGQRDPDPADPDNELVDDPDWVALDVTSDSPVDPRSFALDVSFTTTPPASQPTTDNPGQVVLPGADPVVVPNVRVFARTDRTSPYTPYRPSKGGTVHVDVTLDGAVPEGGSGLTSTAVVTVKTADELVAGTDPFTVNAAGGRLSGSAELDFDVDAGTDYWVEVSIHDPVVGANVGTKVEATIAVGDEAPIAETVPVQTHRPDVQGVFPSGNRGWGIAGYNADHPDASGADAINTSLLRLTPPGATGDLNEDTEVPKTLADPADVVGDPAAGFAGSYPYLPWAGPDGGAADRWRAAEKAELNGTGTTLQSARLGEEVPLEAAPTTSTGRPAPETLEVAGDFNFALGLVAGFTAAAGGGRQLRDFTDLNGDGFADIRNGATVEFTGPRGHKVMTADVAENTSTTALAVGGGLSASPVAISSGDSSTQSSRNGTRVAPTSKKKSRGMNLGLGVDISSQWTNPLPNGEADNALSDAPGDAPDIRPEGTLVERALLDINGDGLPDRVDTYTSGEMWVNLNLGYRFAGDRVLWSQGRVDATKDLSGTLSAGFQLNAYEFAGGVAYTEGVGIAQMMWVDIDGDGVPDRMEQITAAQPRTIFGAAEGMARDPVVYGTYAEGEVAVDAANELTDVDLGQQMSVSRTTALSGGFDLSFYIGPICVVACYIVLNPGAHGAYDRTTTQIALEDMNGDGYVDIVKSTDDADVAVRLNRRGRTNLLREVRNPLGGAVRLDYTRQGNTVEQPESLWVMSSVEVDDGRPGDGKSIQRSEYDYSGNLYDRLHRTLLGFRTVVERQYETSETHVYPPAPGEATTSLQQTLLRSYERTYRNATPFDAGLLTLERLLDTSGNELERSAFAYELAYAHPSSGTLGDPAAAMPEPNDPGRVVLFDLALAPRLTVDEFTRTDADDDVQGTRTSYTYDALGNTLTVHESNELETETDDTFTVMTYEACTSPRSAATIGDEATWVGVPATVTVHAGPDATGEVVRHRDGSLDICANSVPIRLVETQGEDACGRAVYAVTELTFDEYGSYNAVRYPTNALVGAVNGSDCDSAPQPPPPPTGDATFVDCATSPDPDRYCVEYQYDARRFTDVGRVTDSHGVTSSATYDPLTGRMRSRTDENGNVTEYRYDPQGRIHQVVAPRERAAFLADGATATVTYHYGLPSDGHAWAVARHHDAFNAAAGDPDVATIDTATFVDGIGRVVQRKRDADVDGVDGPAAIVEGAVDFDALGREIRQWYPVVEPAGPWPGSGLPDHLTTYNTWNSSLPTATTHVPVTAPTVREFDLLDRLLRTTLPDGSQLTTGHDIREHPDPSHAGLTVFSTTTTDPLGQATTRYVDVRGLTLRREDGPADETTVGDGLLAALPEPGIAPTSRIAPSKGTGEAPIVTSYDYDVLGRLTGVTDTAGAETRHTYDLMDNRLTTETPDAGLVERWYTPAGEVGRQVDAVLRPLGGAVTYDYDGDRLVEVDYSDATPDVTYRYGDPSAPAADNVRGRVVEIVDGSMTRTYTYDVDGNVATEKATRRLDPFGIGATDPQPGPFTTAWAHDSLGRLRTLSYPEGEVLTYDYDRGGMPTRLASTAPQHDLYDQFGTAVPRPDLDVTYVAEVRYDEFLDPTYLRTGTGVETRWTHEPERRFLTGVATGSTSQLQFDGTTSTARPLQALRYRYDAVGNVLDVVNALYDGGGATTLDELGDVPENNVPGPAQQAYTYDGHYRLTGAVGRYIDRQEDRDFSYAVDRAPNGNLLSKAQTTTTTGTTGSVGDGGGGGPEGGKGNAKKGDETDTSTDGSTTVTDECDGNTGSGGGSFNQDPETTYVLGEGDLEYDSEHPHRLVRAGDRTYTFDAVGNQTGWVQPCSSTTLERNLEWDAENRLVHINQGSNSTDYRYNAEGALALERGPGGTLWFVNEHWRVANDGHRYANVFIGETMVASHRTSPAPPPPAPCDPTVETCTCDPATQACSCDDPATCGCDTATNLYDPDTATCQPLPDLTIHFIHRDLQGSLRVATDERGDVFQYLEYLPTGRPWVAGQSRIKDTPYLFAGGFTDATYKMVNFGSRWFDPREEQFYSAEPLLDQEPWQVVNDPSLQAAYTYASANPLRWVDPDGRASQAAGQFTGWNGFDPGTNLEKHQQGHIRISDSKRAARPAPALTFGGRYSNDGVGQARQDAWQTHADRAERFSTILSIETDRKRVRLFGVTLTKQPAPNPAPGNTGGNAAAGANLPQPAAPTPPPRPTSPTPSQPPSSSPAGIGTHGGAPTGPPGGSPAAPPPAPAAGSDSAKSRSGSLSAPSVMPPLPPLPASAAAAGADDG